MTLYIVSRLTIPLNLARAIFSVSGVKVEGILIEIGFDATSKS
jgi:hypothetical protein